MRGIWAHNATKFAITMEMYRINSINSRKTKINSSVKWYHKHKIRGTACIKGWKRDQVSGEQLKINHMIQLLTFLEWRADQSMAWVELWAQALFWASLFPLLLPTVEQIQHNSEKCEKNWRVTGCKSNVHLLLPPSLQSYLLSKIHPLSHLTKYTNEPIDISCDMHNKVICFQVHVANNVKICRELTKWSNSTRSMARTSLWRTISIGSVLSFTGGFTKH